MLKKGLKVKLILGAILLGILIFTCVFFWPHSLMDSTAQIVSVEYYGEDVTNEVDMDKLYEILSQMHCYRNLNPIGAYHLSDAYIQIWVACDNGPIVAFLGNVNYVKKDSTHYNVVNLEETKIAIESLIQQSNVS